MSLFKTQGSRVAIHLVSKATAQIMQRAPTNQNVGSFTFLTVKEQHKNQSRLVVCSGFPPLGASCMFFRAWHRFLVFLRLAPLSCFPALVTGCVFPRLARVACFSRLASVA